MSWLLNGYTSASRQVFLLTNQTLKAPLAAVPGSHEDMPQDCSLSTLGQAWSHPEKGGCPSPGGASLHRFCRWSQVPSFPEGRRFLGVCRDSLLQRKGSLGVWRLRTGTTFFCPHAPGPTPITKIQKSHPFPTISLQINRFFHLFLTSFSFKPTLRKQCCIHCQQCFSALWQRKASYPICSYICTLMQSQPCLEHTHPALD